MSHGIERAIYSCTIEFMARLLSLYCCRLHGICTSYFLVFILRYKYLERCHDDFFQHVQAVIYKLHFSGRFSGNGDSLHIQMQEGEIFYVAGKHIASFVNILSTRRYKKSFSRYACPWINIWSLSNCRMHRSFLLLLNDIVW